MSEQHILSLDATPIPSDWEDIHKLFADMKRFARENPKHIFICADDPGMHYQPPRVPRMGWSAFLDNAEDEQSKLWTITIHNLKKSMRPSCYEFMLADEDPEREPRREAMKTLMSTKRGRETLLEAIVRRPVS